MLVCLCQSFKQLLQTIALLISFFSHSRTTTTRGSVFSLCFFLFSLFCLLYRFIFYTNYLGIVLIFRFVCSWLFSPLTSQRLWFLLFLNYTPLFIRQKCNLQAPSLRFHLYKSKCAKHFSPQRKLPSLPFSLALSLSSSRTILTKRFCIYRKKRERSFTEKVTLSLFLSPYDSFVSVDATIFFFRDLSIRSRDRSTSWYVYNVIFTDSLQKILCTVHEDCSVYAEFYATKTRIYDLSSHFLASLEICLAFRVPFRFFLYITSND